MRKFYVTSWIFSGRIKLIYNEAGLLTVMDFSGFIGSTVVHGILLKQMPAEVTRLLRPNALGKNFKIEEVQNG